MKKIIIIIISKLLLVWNSCYSQDSIHYQIHAKTGIGSVLPHYSFMNYIVNDYISTYEIDITSKSYGSSIYDSLYRYPSLGFGIQYSTLGNEAKWGHTYNVFAVFDATLFSTQRFNFYYQFNLGLGFLNKSLRKNIYNTALSSTINAYAGIDLYATYKINQFQSLKTGFELSHLSNGKTQTPNLGINYGCISLSYIRNIGVYPDVITNSSYKNETLIRKYNIRLFVTTGIKHDDFLTETLFHTISTRLDYEYRLSYKYGLIMGLSGFYDESIRVPNYSMWTQKADYGIHIGAQSHYRKLSISIEAGRYLSDFHLDKKYFHRLTLIYEIIPAVYVQIGVKSHLASADFLEIGFGYALVKDHQQGGKNE